jgi:hypothetical protein
MVDVGGTLPGKVKSVISSSEAPINQPIQNPNGPIRDPNQSVQDPNQPPSDPNELHLQDPNVPVQDPLTANTTPIVNASTDEEISQVQTLPKKQKIPPVVATLLLLAFAVAIGVVVMSFGRAQVELEAVCPINIGLEFSVIGGKEDYCYDGSELRFTVENGININIEGLVVNIIGVDKAETIELKEAKLSKAGTYIGKVSFPASGGSIRQVKISPKVSLKGQQEICVDKALIVESIPSC